MTGTIETSSLRDWVALDFINWRTALDLTQKDAARLLDYSSRTIINWEKDDRCPIKRHIMLACLYIEARPDVIPRLIHRPAGRSFPHDR
jgi:DNA-binding XRE family transcriptional regulator